MIPIPEDIAKKILFTVKNDPYVSGPDERRRAIREHEAAYRYIEVGDNASVKKLVRLKFPSDFRVQKYEYDSQMMAKMIMDAAADDELKDRAEILYPSDFSMQKYEYENQLFCKQYMRTTPKNTARSMAEEENPEDYVTQKYVYDMLMYGDEE